MTEAALVTIAEATTADVAGLVALDQRNFKRGDWFDRPLWVRILGQQTGRGEMLTLTARDRGLLVGAIVGRFRTTRAELVVWSIAVDESFRGSGLARRLMAELVGRAALDYRTVSLEARRDNLRARRFYERLGFRAVREIRGGYADGTDAIRYLADLPALRALLAAPPEQ